MQLVEKMNGGVGAVIYRMVQRQDPQLVQLLTLLVLGNVLDQPGYNSPWKFMADHGVPGHVMDAVFVRVFHPWADSDATKAKFGEEPAEAIGALMGRGAQDLSPDEVQMGIRRAHAGLVRDLAGTT
jgi:hypothetical protein